MQAFTELANVIVLFWKHTVVPLCLFSVLVLSECVCVCVCVVVRVVGATRCVVLGLHWNPVTNTFLRLLINWFYFCGELCSSCVAAERNLAFIWPKNAVMKFEFSVRVTTWYCWNLPLGRTFKCYLTYKPLTTATLYVYVYSCVLYVNVSLIELKPTFK